MPYTVALVMAGLVLGTAHAFEAPHLTQELLYALFLPGLLFEAAFALEYRKSSYLSPAAMRVIEELRARAKRLFAG